MRKQRTSTTFPRDPTGTAVESWQNWEFKYYQLVAATDSGVNLAFTTPVHSLAIMHTDLTSIENVRIDFDEIATANSIPLPGGIWIPWNLTCKVVHAYSIVGTPRVYVVGGR